MAIANANAESDCRLASDIAESVVYIPETVLCVPLFYGERVIGALELLDEDGGGSFSAADMEALALFVNQGRRALQLSRTYQSVTPLLRDDPALPPAEDDAESRDALPLAALVHEIARRGDEERRACRAARRLRQLPPLAAGHLRRADRDMTASPRPAWALEASAVPLLEPIPDFDDITPEWAWGDGTGKGVKVAVIDSGVDADHPAVGGVNGYVSLDEPDGAAVSEARHEDVFGHGTACAGIIRSLAPDCKLYSVRVLGPKLYRPRRGVPARAASRDRQRMDICNLSLGSTGRELFEPLHELADLAYFHRVAVLTAANNFPIRSAPSLYASRSSLSLPPRSPTPSRCTSIHAADRVRRSRHRRARRLEAGGWITTTGNSFAAPHITGLVARIRAKHPGLAPFHLKAILRSLAANVSRNPVSGSAPPG